MNTRIDKRETSTSKLNPHAKWLTLTWSGWLLELLSRNNKLSNSQINNRDRNQQFISKWFASFHKLSVMKSKSPVACNTPSAVWIWCALATTCRSCLTIHCFNAMNLKNNLIICQSTHHPGAIQTQGITNLITVSTVKYQ